MRKCEIKKILKALLAIVLAGVVVAAGVGVGYIIKEKGLFNRVDESSENYADYDSAEKIAENEFYEQWDYYESYVYAVFVYPEHVQAD